MYDFVYRKKRLVQFILALITLPFAFFGVDYYFRSGNSLSEVARVAGDQISQAEFNDALREQQERMRQQLGKNYDPVVFENPEVRMSLLDQLVGQRLLDQQARKNRFRVSDDQVRQYISEIPAFQVDGKFSQQRYEQLLAAQSPAKTSAAFVNDVRQALTLAPLQEPISAGNIVAKSNVLRYLSLLDQQREVSFATIAPDAFMKSVKVDDAAVAAYYDANIAAFQVPAQAQIEYVVLTPDALASQVSVDAAEVRKQYDDNVKQYAKAEERQASHILIAVKPDASDADKAAAKARAEALAAQARKAPAQFGELAVKNSQDPGSAAQGGDLGSFARDGSMVKPFEDAVFSAKQGDIVGPVQTDFGWHVIKVTGVKTAKSQPFDEVKLAIEKDLQQQKAVRKFAEAADQFQNLVYEQADSLAPVAKALGLPVQTTPFVTRAQAQQIASGNAKLVQALFSPESIAGKRNTDAIEVGPNALMAARIVEYRPAAARPFDAVQDEIRRQLARQAAIDLAQKAGREKLALLEQGRSDHDVGVVFAQPVALVRNRLQPGFTPEATTRIFQLDPAALPRYVGGPSERGGFAIYRLVKVVMPPSAEPAKLATAKARIAEMQNLEIFDAYVNVLKTKAKVEINQANLDKK
jgi:peptidyl-prolyl cis-trans isomerase D